MELYIHIPFCKQKCQYCDFVSFKSNDDEMDIYIQCLKKEIEKAGDKYEGRQIDTIYIGGGTPSILNVLQLTRIVTQLRESFDLSNVKEFTIECNPESLTEEKLILFKYLKINRISIGVQSLNDQNLTEIGRIHDRKEALKKVRLAAKYFDNVSCDLIIGLPYDTKASIKEEINMLSKYCNHLSMYELILEEGTKLFDRVKSGEVKLLDDDKVEDLFKVAKETAKNNGFDRYEVSNFAKNGKISLHNYGYWTREEYLGFGLNASSFVKGVLEKRYKNVKSLEEYKNTIIPAVNYDNIEKVESEILSKEDIIKEEIMLGLRTTKGIKKDKIKALIPKKLEKYFEEDGEYIHLTDEGMSVMNSILCEII